MKERFDLILGFGNACSCSQILRAAGLQLLSFPFDWVIYESDDDLRRRADAVTGDFSGWLERDDLVFRGNVDWHDKDIYFNTATGCLFNHEIPKGATLEEAFPAVRAKYDRRIRRMFEIMRKSTRVLVVRIDRPDQTVETSVSDCTYLLERLSAKFPAATFDLLLLNFKKGRSPDDRLADNPAPHVTRVAFDYKDPDPASTDYAPDIPLVANLLAERYEVADYRTEVEIAALRHRRRLAKYRRFGATSYLGYKVAKVRLWLEERFHPALIRARIHRHRYAQIVPLGVNCEVGFRFYRKWGFLDSSLLAWAQTFNLATVTRVLGDLGRLMTGPATLHEVSKMWHCEQTGTFFHGQLKWDRGHRDYTEAEIADDLANLRGRIAHLKTKLLDYLANDGETLLVHRLSDGDAVSGDLDVRLRALEAALAKLDARNCTLLVITERKHLPNMPSAPNRVFRAVEKFNPCDRVTDPDAGDTLGWNAVFTEFAPKRILEKKHAFKFE